MGDAMRREGSTIIPRIILGLAVANLLFLATEIAINVLGAILPL